MKTHRRFVRVLLLSGLMAMLVASAALAKTGGLGFIRLSASGDVTTTCPSPSPSPSPSASRSPQVKTTGLDHAIEMVLANCIKNPQAPGLLNALQHLVANRDRHAAHDADKAARRAAHDAAKAEHLASKGHGH